MAKTDKEILKAVREQSKIYQQTKDKNELPDGEYFFAFSQEQLDKGLAKMRQTTQAEVFNLGMGGMIGTKKASEELNKFFAEKENLIRQTCSPFGVFYYEYANHEGDYGARDSEFNDEAEQITKEYFPDFNFADPNNRKVIKAIVDDWRNRCL